MSTSGELSVQNVAPEELQQIDSSYFVHEFIRKGDVVVHQDEMSAIFISS
jgi:hypothetical protein